MTVFDINLPCGFLRELAVKVWSWAFVSEWFIPVLTLVLEAECNMWFLSTAGVIPTCRKDILITVLCWDRLSALWQNDLAADVLQGADNNVWINCSPDIADICYSDKLGAALTKRKHSWPTPFCKVGGWVAFSVVPSLKFPPAAMRWLLLKGSWRKCGGEEMTC